MEEIVQGMIAPLARAVVAKITWISLLGALSTPGIRYVNCDFSLRRYFYFASLSFRQTANAL